MHSSKQQFLSKLHTYERNYFGNDYTERNRAFQATLSPNDLRVCRILVKVVDILEDGFLDDYDQRIVNMLRKSQVDNTLLQIAKDEILESRFLKYMESPQSSIESENCEQVNSGSNERN